MDVLARLSDLGLALPAVTAPKGAYQPATRSGNLLFVSGHVPIVDGTLLATGKVGAEVSAKWANDLAHHCALATLAAIDDTVGLDKVVQVVKLTGFVASAEGFTGQPGVIDGASDLFVSVFGDEGRHARSSVGVAQLPLGAPVEIEVIVEVADDVVG